MNQKIKYIHDNPVCSGLVSQAEDYLYSSARNYAGLERLIEIQGIHVSIDKIPLIRRLR